MADDLRIDRRHVIPGDGLTERSMRVTIRNLGQRVNPAAQR